MLFTAPHGAAYSITEVVAPTAATVGIPDDSETPN
jgi:hypothetical protein